MDLRTLARAYDRSAATYDDRFRALQRPKYRAGISLLESLQAAPSAVGSDSLLLDAGAGTGLFAEWLADPADAESGTSNWRTRLQELVAHGRLIALDASLEMVKRSAPRGARPLAADLAFPPLQNESFALIASFTALLENVPASLRALGKLLRPGGFLLVSFLARESPTVESLCAFSGLARTVPPLAAGQDLVHLLQRE